MVEALVPEEDGATTAGGRVSSRGREEAAGEVRVEDGEVTADHRSMEADEVAEDFNGTAFLFHLNPSLKPFSLLLILFPLICQCFFSSKPLL
jgi:hypothetical protein